MLRHRFQSPPHPEAVAFGSSVTEDAVLLTYDILGSLAHARMLARQGLIPRPEGRALVRGLARLHADALAGRVTLDPALEDVHMNVETLLTERLGKAGARLPTGRSRNDQVATDLALYLRHTLLEIESLLLEAAGALLEVAGSPQGRIVVPAATHLQDAQRVYLAQVLQVHAHRLLRDAGRLARIREGLYASPLGAGALAGSSLPLDPEYTAELLGFPGANPNSLDAVSDRDPASDALAAFALLGVHLSSLAEEWVLWSTPQFGRLLLHDSFVTTSSLMPHKRNPDMAELLRAEAGPLLGLSQAHLTILKGLPLAYNRDLQAGKPLLFEGARRAARALRVLAPMVRTATFRSPAEERHAGQTASVELANALTAAGVPFREAHARVAQLLGELGRDGRELGDVGRDEWRERFPELGAGGWQLPSPDEEPERRSTRGGSAWSEVTRDREGLATEVRDRGRAVETGRDRWEAMVRRLLDEPVSPASAPGRPPRGRGGRTRAPRSRRSPPR